MTRRDAIPVALLTLVCAALLLAPGVKTAADDGIRAEVAKVLSVDDSGLSRLGLLDFGSQVLEVEILTGPRRGGRFRANNEIRAQLDLDKRFRPGDLASVSVPDSPAPDTVLAARDHWRNGWSLALFAIFGVLLCVFGGWTGAKALLSFALGCLVVWKAVVPLSLAGWPAAWVSFAAVCALTAAITYLVAGPTRKGAAAFFGSMLGVLACFGTAKLFGTLMHINGATLPFVQTLLYAGYESIDLADVCIGATVLAASGAVMDLAMDIASGVEEVARHRPGLPARELFMSGVRIGRSVTGTMTTTLLLAYSGGYLTLLMVFAAQGTPPSSFLTSSLVSTELVKTLVGSFSLVLVAPFTALASAIVFSKHATATGKQEDQP